MKQRLDICNFDERLRGAESKIDAQNPISARNAQLIRDFEQYCFSEGLGKARILKYLQPYHQAFMAVLSWFIKALILTDVALQQRIFFPLAATNRKRVQDYS